MILGLDEPTHKHMAIYILTQLVVTSRKALTGPLLVLLLLHPQFGAASLP